MMQAIRTDTDLTNQVEIQVITNYETQIFEIEFAMKFVWSKLASQQNR